MKFNLNALKNMFSALRKSPIDDMAINAVKNNADDVARLAANSMPSTGSTLQKVLSNADDMSEVIDFMPLDKHYVRALDPSGGTDYFGVHSYEPPYFDSEDNVTYPGELFGVGNGGVTSPNNIHGFPDNVPFEDLVTEISSDHSLYNIRPHKNTALGKYYQKQLNSKPHLTSSEFVNNYKAQMHDKSETRELLNLFPEQYANAPTELDLANAPLSEEPVNFKLDSTPDYDSMIIDPRDYGQDPALIDSVDYPDGFRNPEDFARYYEDLEYGVRTDPTLNVLGHSVSMPKYDSTSNFRHKDFGNRNLYDRAFIIDGRPYTYPRYGRNWYTGEMMFSNPQDLLKSEILDKYANAYNYKLESLPYDELPEFVDLKNKYGFFTAFHSDEFDPVAWDSVFQGHPTKDLPNHRHYYQDGGLNSWRPHSNDSLGKFFKKYGRLPNGISPFQFNAKI